MDDGTCCPGWTLDTTTGDTSITLHGHALLTPELLDTLLTRISRHAATLDRLHHTTLWATYGTGDDTPDT